MPAGMNSIEGGRWDNLLRRYFTIKERGVAPSIAPEIVPYFPVEAADNPTFDFLRGVKLAAATIQQAPVAAEFSQVVLHNPAGSGTIITVIAMEGWLTVDGSVEFRLGFDLPAGGTGGPEVSRDTRWARGVTAALLRTVGVVERSTAVAHLGTLFNTHRVLTNTVGEFRHPVVLAPNGSAFIETAVVNILLNASFVWSERPVEDGEL